MSKDLVHPEQRVGVFVDVQNIYHSAKHLYGARINFEGLIKATELDCRKHMYSLNPVEGCEGDYFECAMDFRRPGREEGPSLGFRDCEVFVTGPIPTEEELRCRIDNSQRAGVIEEFREGEFGLEGHDPAEIDRYRREFEDEHRDEYVDFAQRDYEFSDKYRRADEEVIRDSKTNSLISGGRSLTVTPFFGFTAAPVGGSTAGVALLGANLLGYCL